MALKKKKTDNFWDLTHRPYTQLKLQILKEYLSAWAKIFFNQASAHKDWSNYQEVYYVDCFAGRGKYNLDGQKDVVNGSPLIALKCASELQKQPKYKGIKLKCILIEFDSRLANKLESFCEPFKGVVDYKIYKHEDFNQVINDVLKNIEGHPAFFFVDPDGIKELKKENIEQIVTRKGPTDVLLNYIKGGVERIAGLTKKHLPEILNHSAPEKYIKTIKTLTDFYGLKIFSDLNKTEQQRLKEWTNSILQSSQLKEVAVFDMQYKHKSDNIYYLLFASRKQVAKKIMTDIFKKAKTHDYKGQGRLPIYDEKSFDL